MANFLSDIFGGLFGSKQKTQQAPTMNPQQLAQLLQYIANPIQNQQGYQQGQGFLNKLYNDSPGSLQEFAAPYMQHFNEQIAPGIAERFAGGILGGTGGSGLSSSGLNNSLAQAGRSLETDISGQRFNAQLGGLGTQLQYAQQPYSNAFTSSGLGSFENLVTPPRSGLAGGLFSALNGGLGF